MQRRSVQVKTSDGRLLRFRVDFCSLCEHSALLASLRPGAAVPGICHTCELDTFFALISGERVELTVAAGLDLVSVAVEWQCASLLVRLFNFLAVAATVDDIMSLFKRHSGAAADAMIDLLARSFSRIAPRAAELPPEVVSRIVASPNCVRNCGADANRAFERAIASKLAKEPKLWGPLIEQIDFLNADFDVLDVAVTAAKEIGVADKYPGMQTIWRLRRINAMMRERDELLGKMPDCQCGSVKLSKLASAKNALEQPEVPGKK
jgi:hypothetical protein